MEEKVLTTTNKIKHNLAEKSEVKLVKANYKTIKTKITKLTILPQEGIFECHTGILN